jgi:hypothetical protein
MKTKDASLYISAWNTGFSTLVCTTLGLLLLEACFLRIGAKPTAHIFTVLVGTTFTTLIYRRIAGYRPTGQQRLRWTETGGYQRLISTSHLMSAALFIGVGYLGPTVFALGWVTPSALYIICLFLFPWSSMRFFRRSLPASWAMVSFGAIAGLLTERQNLQPLLLGMSIWMLWLSATFAWLRLIFIKHGKLGISSQ